LLRVLAAAASLFTSWLLTLIAFYWTMQGGGSPAVIAFLVMLVLSILLTTSAPWSGEETSES